MMPYKLWEYSDTTFSYKVPWPQNASGMLCANAWACCPDSHKVKHPAPTYMFNKGIVLSLKDIGWGYKFPVCFSTLSRPGPLAYSFIFYNSHLTTQNKTKKPECEGQNGWQCINFLLFFSSAGLWTISWPSYNWHGRKFLSKTQTNNLEAGRKNVRVGHEVIFWALRASRVGGSINYPIVAYLLKVL